MNIQLLLQEEVQEFINSHTHSDPADLAFKYREVAGVPISIVLDQIVSRKKCLKKLSSWATAKNIIFPPPLSIEQASSESTGKYKSELIWGNTLYDLTGGMGVDTSFFSRNFDKVVHVEKNPLLSEIAQHNFRVFGLTKTEFKNADANTVISEIRNAHVYIDPSRRNLDKKVFILTECEPDIISLVPELLANGNSILLKLSPLLDLKEAERQLPPGFETHIVSVRNEVKEVLLLYTNNSKSLINCRDLDYKGWSFLSKERVAVDSVYGDPSEYIYEPMAALLKAGLMKELASKMKLTKIAPNSHLFTSEELIKDFPGKLFELKDVLSVKEAKRKFKKANVSTRNFPLDAPGLKKKLSVTDGGEVHLMGTTLMNGEKVVLELKRISL